MPNMPSTELSAVLSASAGRAKGAMFLTFFGSAWLALWNQRALHGSYLVFLLIAVSGLSIFSLAFGGYRTLRAYAEADASSPEKRRVVKLFNVINAAQWIIILVVSNVLANLGWADWIIPAAILVVGLHFLPLAKLFATKGHFYLGLAISLFAIAYPFVLSGPTDPYGCFGVGVMLWSYSLWRLTIGWHAPTIDRSVVAVSTSN